MPKTITVSVDIKKYPPEVLRYAAYAQTGAAYVFIEPSAKGAWRVSFEPKKEAGAAALKKSFLLELEDELLRSGVSAANKELREFMIARAIAGPSGAAPAQESGLTKAQEKELDDLIAQVEREIKAESGSRAARDPLGLTKTWEEKYAKRKK